MPDINDILHGEAITRTLRRQASLIHKIFGRAAALRLVLISYFRERPNMAALSDEELHSIGHEVNNVVNDFFSVSCDSEIQVRKLILPLAQLFVLRTNLLTAAFAYNEQRMSMIHLLYSNPSPFPTFRESFHPTCRRAAWAFAAMVSHAFSEARNETRDGVQMTRRVLDWMQRNLHGFVLNVPNLLLVHAILEILLLVHDDRHHVVTNTRQHI